MASSEMASVAVDKVDSDSMFVDKLPEEINEMKIRDDKVEKVAPGLSRIILLYFGVCLYDSTTIFS